MTRAVLVSLVLAALVLAGCRARPAVVERDLVGPETLVSRGPASGDTGPTGPPPASQPYVPGGTDGPRTRYRRVGVDWLEMLSELIRDAMRAGVSDEAHAALRQALFELAAARDEGEECAD